MVNAPGRGCRVGPPTFGAAYLKKASCGELLGHCWAVHLMLLVSNGPQEAGELWHEPPSLENQVR